MTNKTNKGNNNMRNFGKREKKEKYKQEKKENIKRETSAAQISDSFVVYNSEKKF